jgi:hypothetical protein
MFDIRVELEDGGVRTFRVRADSFEDAMVYVQAGLEANGQDTPGIIWKESVG